MEQPAAESDTIEADWFCVSCGYNLRSLVKSGRCPECNTPIPKSLRMRYLSGADQSWLRSLHRGALITGTSLALYFSIMLLTLVAPALPPNRVIYAISSRAPMLVSWLLLSTISTIGYCRMLSVEKNSMDERAARSATFIRRLVVVLFLASLFGGFLLRLSVIRDFVYAWYIGLSLLDILIDVLINRYLSGISRRIPHLTLARNFQTLSWLTPLGAGVGILFPYALLFLHAYRFYSTPGLLISAEIVRLGIGCLATFALLRLAAAIKQVLHAQQIDGHTPSP